MSQPSKPEISVDELTLDEAGTRWSRWSAALGVFGLAAAGVMAVVLEDGAARFYRSYLVSFCYFISLALGALFFVMIQHLTRAGWSVLVRRIAEAISVDLVVPLAPLILPVIFGMRDLYPWARPDAVAHDPLLQAKAPYLNVTFFVARCVVYLGAWGWLARSFYRRSVEQDRSGDASLTLQMERRSGWAMIVFALTTTFFSFDFLMSLSPRWSSTIFGVYYFAGSVVGFFALLPVTIWILQRSGRLRRAITIEHYHDMGKLVFAFSVFWAYIAFSQYMLMWYANLPEETEWYLRRQTGGWVWVSVLLLVGHFLVPFLALLSRLPKRRPGILVAAAAWVLVLHWLDVYWLVMPETSGGRVPLHLLDLACFAGVGGFCALAVLRRLHGRYLVPAKDPRLVESLRFENV